jgi:hypothetical protein
VYIVKILWSQDEYGFYLQLFLSNVSSFDDLSKYVNVFIIKAVKSMQLLTTKERAEIVYTQQELNIVFLNLYELPKSDSIPQGSYIKFRNVVNKLT